MDEQVAAGAQLLELGVGQIAIDVVERAHDVVDRERRVPEVHLLIGEPRVEAERRERDRQPGGERDRVARQPVPARPELEQQDDERERRGERVVADRGRGEHRQQAEHADPAAIVE
jgi:hypothetical protein